MSKWTEYSIWIVILGLVTLIYIWFPPVQQSSIPVKSKSELILEITELKKQNLQLQNDLNQSNKQLQKYIADEKYIKALPGASEDVAQKIIKASGALNVDPK